ncbi:MAG TPA: pyridoxal 5'-phosphate synthase glutaminase subunit PdxT [Methanobacteriaceae archaeon]|nr:pyridoxal 5'-phosphate synthase glutaminase subunit PdxT [Methanobacteriaceae archaeon]
MIKIGILDLQGDVWEHLEMTQKTIAQMGLDAEVTKVKSKEEVAQCQGIIISGGESTIIGKLIEEEGIDEVIKDQKIPVMGTCAGMVLLGTETDYQQPLIGLIPMKVKRNGFGRQKVSFEQEIDVFDRKYHGIFIRAPYAHEVKEGVEILSKIEDKIVAVGYQGNLAVSFHPELSEDTRIHEYFIKEVAKCVE